MTNEIKPEHWMPYEEFLVYQEELRRKEQNILRKNGLGWLLDFQKACQESNTES